MVNILSDMVVHPGGITSAVQSTSPIDNMNVSPHTASNICAFSGRVIAIKRLYQGTSATIAGSSRLLSISDSDDKIP